MENELINVKNEDGKLLVSGKELHDKLGIKTVFLKWIKRMCGYGFEENIDYIKATQKKVTLNNEGKNRAYNKEDYIITIDMAKEISMLQKSEVGREFRKYFIECEKQLKEVNQKPQLSPQEQLALQLFNGGIDAITACFYDVK